MRALVFAVVCVSFVSVGCGGKILAESTNGGTHGAGESSGAPDPKTGGSGARAVDDVDAGTPSANDPFHVGDDWVGMYVCEGGPTNLDLHIVAMDDDQIRDALFQFDLDGVTGSYHVTGYFDPATGEAGFAPGEWIHEPDGYTGWPLVGMTGATSGDSFTGMMTSTACGEVALTK